MKNRSISSGYKFRFLLFVICLSFGFAVSTKCEAQSIVGKWHRTGTSSFKIDKATGKLTPLFTAEQQKEYDKATAANEYNEVLEFKSDNTYTSNVSAKGRNPTVRTEKYTLSGNTLDLNIPPVHNEKTTITVKSLTASSMTWDLHYMDKVTEIVYARLK